MKKREYILLAEKIKPVMHFSKEGFCYVAPPEKLFQQLYFPLEYLAYAKAGKKARGLKEICVMDTYHMWGYDRRFKPRSDEIVAQIPTGLRKSIVAFRIVQEPEPLRADRKKAGKEKEIDEAYKAGCHTALTMFYGNA